MRLGPARGHARSGDAAAISGYLGPGDRFDRAVADFSEAYADQTEADDAAFVRGPGFSAREWGYGWRHEPTEGRRRMILSILVTLAFVATLAFMLVRAFTGPVRHRHGRPVH